MKASKRNEERMTWTEEGWTMNGMVYEKCKACQVCGDPYFRRVTTGEDCCSEPCNEKRKLKEKMARLKKAEKERARRKIKEAEVKIREREKDKAHRRYVYKLNDQKDRIRETTKASMERKMDKKTEKIRKAAFDSGFDAGKDIGMEDCDIIYQKGRKAGMAEQRNKSAVPYNWKKIPGLQLYMSKQGIVYGADKAPVQLHSRGDDKRLTFKYKKKEYFVHETVLFLFGGPRPIGCYAGHKFSSAVTMNEVGQRNLMYMKKAY